MLSGNKQERKNGKKALLVVSFGTSFEEALPAIVNIEETCKKAFPDYDFYRAFTSGMIIRKWARTKNVIIHNPDEVMKRLVAEGYEEVICQPTHIINGLEYDKMMNMLLAYKDQIPTIKVGTPSYRRGRLQRSLRDRYAGIRKAISERRSFCIHGTWNRTLCQQRIQPV